MAEEAQKRNTDCVYFLASPLTCKKGIHCEFRHSKAARFNPWDCRYWLAGNCLNANCSFRHPPLDGRPALVLASASAPSKAASRPSSSATANKSRAPCYFFSQGYCSKGDRCAFFHDLSVSMSAQAVVAQKSPKAAACKGVEINDKPPSVSETKQVETNGLIVKEHGSQDAKPVAGIAPTHSLQPFASFQAQEMPHINNVVAASRNLESLRSLSSSKHQIAHASSVEVYDVRQSVEHTQQQRQGSDEAELAGTRQQQSFMDEERAQNGTWRNGAVKEAPDESDNSNHGEDLHYRIVNAHILKRPYPCQDMHEFGLRAPLSLEQESYERFNMLYKCDSQHSHLNSRGRHKISPFHAIRDRNRMKGDFRTRLGKHRNFSQDQLLGINGYIGCCQDTDDYADVNEGGQDDWASCQSNRHICWKRLQGADCGKVYSPHYGVGLDVREDNVDLISSGSSHMRFSLNECQRSKYSCGSRRARHYLRLDATGLEVQHSSAQHKKRKQGDSFGSHVALPRIA